MARKWSEEKVIEEIKILNKKGFTLSADNTRKLKSSLYGAGVYYFGSWRKAIKAVGIDYFQISRQKHNYWTKKKVINRILELNSKGINLTYQNLNTNYSDLSHAASRLFDSYKLAIKAAGLDYDEISKYKSWDREKIVDSILDLWNTHDDFSTSYIQKYYASLYLASVRHFGSWKNTVKAANLNYEEIIKFEEWNKDKVVEKILELQKNRTDLSSLFMQKNFHKLYGAGVRHFGSWGNAIQVTGLDYNEILKHQVWSEEKIIEEILFLRENGEELSSKNVSLNYSPLINAGIRSFGSWKKAIEKAGLDYDQIRKIEYWNREKVLEKILELSKKGEDLSYTNVFCIYSNLPTAAEKYFGSWERAVTNAGLDYSEINRYSWREEWNKEKIKARIIELYDSGEDLSSNPSLTLCSANFIRKMSLTERLNRGFYTPIHQVIA